MSGEGGVLTGQHKWQALIENWPGYVLTLNSEDRLTSLSRSTRTFDPQRDLGKSVFDLIAPERQPDFRAALAATRAGDAGVVRRARLGLADGTWRWYDSRFILIQDSGVMIVSTDVTEEEDGKIALRLLAEASHDFSEATGDYEQLLAVIARRLSEVVGDLCSIRAMSEDGAYLEAGAAYHRDPELVTWAHSLSTAHSQNAGEGVMGRVAASGQSVFMPKVSATDFAGSTLPRYREILERLNVGSVIVVPMKCRGKVVGVASLLRSASERSYTEQDLHLAQNLADHAALAITNARSYAAERVARAAAVSANELLQQSELAHRLLFESSPIPLLVFDVETLSFLAANNAAARLYGYTRDELLKMKLWQLVVAGDHESVLARVAALGDGETVGLARHCRKDGSAFFAEHASRTLVFGGRVARFTLITDVTARHEAEEMRALLAAVVESSNDAIISERLDGSITSWNAAAERLFGYSAAEAIGSPIAIVVPADRLAEERGLRERVASGGRVENFESVRRHKGGALISVANSLAPIMNASGQVVGTSKTIRDLSEQQKAEEALRNTGEQLRQSQKMDAVGRLAGGISHDFNNLLSVILSYSDLVLADLKPNDPACADLTEIRKAALRAADLTRQLLVFSRQQVVAPKVLDLNEVLDSVDKMVRRILGEDIDLVASPSPGLGRVLADRSNIEQVILNLVVNARDAMPTGGKLTIETGNVELDEHYALQHPGAAAGPHVMLAVTDTGVGMDQVTQERIFEPFFTTKGVGKGTGLGLSTVFGVARQSGGSVWVYSEPGEGTTFKVYLPRVDADVERVSPSVPPPSSRGTETILLVEDQEQVRTVAHGILRRNGYRVLVAQHAGEALLVCEIQKERIDLLLTDVVMPQMSGSELAKRLSLKRPDMKVLYMSGYTDDSIVRHGILESEMSFLQKPFTPESLARKVREAINAARE
jgi:two-component system cell cycle sensor histidine kinase/response regulator CckA